MGLRGSHLFVLWVGLGYCFSGEALKTPDPGCKDILHKVVPLGGVAPVLKVERINEELADQLREYTQGATVQSQLSAGGRSGYLAIRDEQIAGFVVVELGRDYVLVKSIGVTRDLWHQGVGTDLMNEVVSRAQQIHGVKDVRVLVEFDDSDSLGFFTSVGLVETEIIPRQFNERSTSGRLLKLQIRDAQTGNLVGAEKGPEPARIKPKPIVSVGTLVKTAPKRFIDRY